MNARFIPQWPVRGASNALTLTCLIRWADGNGLCWASNDQLSAFANCCGETTRKCVNELVKAGCLIKSRSERNDNGAFAMNSYQLDLANPVVARIFASLREAASAVAAQNTGDQQFGNDQGKSKPNSKCPPPSSGTRGYKDTRAGARASSIFLPPSLPDDYFIEAEELRSQVERVLSVCGIGLADIKTPGLLDSLVECLPTALSAG
jgi:hypothetical protein